MTIEEKLLGIVDLETMMAERTGHSRLSTCSARGWDGDVFRYKQDIIDKIESKGYRVTVESNWGVTDIITYKKVKL
ncbi:MAG: hypothetical protein GY900_06650 [Actinomycetia bacterium]|nr:hypothetical protein [Actinomycetes bacterium]